MANDSNPSDGKEDPQLAVTACASTEVNDSPDSGWPKSKIKRLQIRFWFLVAGSLLTFLGYKSVQFSWNAAVEGQIGTLSVEQNWPIRVYLEAGVFIGVGSCVFCFGCLCILSGLLPEGVLSSKAYDRFVLKPIGAPGCAAFLLAIVLAPLVWAGRIFDWVMGMF